MVVMLLVLAGAVLRFGLAPVLLLYAIPQMITAPGAADPTELPRRALGPLIRRLLLPPPNNGIVIHHHPQYVWFVTHRER